MTYRCENTRSVFRFRKFTIAQLLFSF